MKRCKVWIVGLSPYSQSRKTDNDVPRLDREGPDDYDRRVWRHKCTVNKEGVVCVPAMAFKQAIDTSGYKLGLKVPNRRGATYKNFLQSGFLPEGDTPLHWNGKMYTPADAASVTISANSDGIRGSGKRVPRTFPVFERWQCEPSFIITDDIITEDIFEQHVKATGIIVSIGRFRAEKGGINGRFKVDHFEWEDFRV
jgi:hypothetical protein